MSKRNIPPILPGSGQPVGGTAEPRGTVAEAKWTWVDEYKKYLDDHKDDGVNDPTIELLQGLQGNSNMSMLGMLSLFMMGMEDGNMWSTERRDMLLQFLLQYMTSRDQRQYDWTQLQESRLYNNPTNELARLMSAGISRDKAIELLSSGGSGGSSGSPLIGSGSNASAPSVSAPSGSHALDIANTVFNALGTVFGMVAQGFGIKQSVETTKALNNQNHLTQVQIKAIDSANQVGQAVDNMQRDGVLSQEDVNGWTNALDMEKWFRDHLDTNYVAPLVQSGAFENAFGTVQGREMLNKLHDQRLHSRSDGEVFDEFVRQQKAESAILSLNIDQLGAELENTNADTLLKNNQAYLALREACFVTTQDTQAQEMLPFLQRESSARALQAEQTAYNLDEDTTNKIWQGLMLRNEFELNESGFPMLKQCYLQELDNKLAYWLTINDPAVRAEQIKKWKAIESNQAAANYLEAMYYTSAGAYMQNHPNLSRICIGLENIHFFNTLQGFTDHWHSVNDMWQSALNTVGNVL